MNLVLQRMYLPDGTLGVLHHPGGRLWTLEDTLKEGGFAKNSCVPEGTYRLEPHDTERFPNTWALVGNQVSHIPTHGVARSAILFHAGNTTEDTSGCILVGWGFRLGPPPVLEASRVAMRQLRASLSQAAPSEPILLTIKGA